MSYSITPKLIMAAAERRGIKTTHIDESRSLYRLDLPDGRYFFIRNITSIKNGAINNLIAGKKELFYQLLDGLEIPIPATQMYDGDIAAARAFLEKYRQIVVKPTDQSHGNGITTGITNEDALDKALIYALGFSQRILLQQHVTGDDYRLLMIDNRLAAAAIREPASVVGNGTDTVADLIIQENDSERRGGSQYSELLTEIDIAAAERYLGTAMQSIPKAGEQVTVVGVANIGRGGVSIDVTDTVSIAMVAAAEKIANYFSVGLAGIDFIASADGSFYCIEMNTAPSLGLHELPYSGQARQTPDLYLDWLTK